MITLNNIIDQLTQHRTRLPHLADKPVDFHNATDDDAPAVEITSDTTGEPKTLIILNIEEEEEDEPPHKAKKSTRHRKAKRVNRRSYGHKAAVDDDAPTADNAE